LRRSRLGQDELRSQSGEAGDRLATSQHGRLRGRSAR
jgi:hypothetical protein